jgi:hypothetical protein
MFDWISILADGRFEASLPSLVLMKAAGERHEGSGQIVWNASEGLRLRAVTSGEAFLFLGGTHHPIGQILPSGASFQLDGTTQDDFNVLSNPIYDQPKSINLASDTQTWDVPLWFAHLYRKVDADQAAGLFAILKPIRTLHFSRTSHVTDDNPVFGRASKGLDWIELSTSYAKITLRKDKDGMLRVCIDAEMTLSELEHALESVRLAISFLEGKALDVIGFAARCAGFLHRRVNGRHRDKERVLAQPLPSIISLPGMHDILLQHAAEFFQTQRGRQYSDSLRMCWDCIDNYASIRAITTCAALENLIRLTGGHEAGQRSGEQQSKDADDEKDRLDFLSDLLTKNANDVGEKVVQRILGILKSSHHLQPKNVLHDWERRGFLKVEKKDIDAWNELRNSVAHGHLAFNDPDMASREINYHYQKRIENLINRITLHAMGYKETYFDYAHFHPMPMSNPTVE